MTDDANAKIHSPPRLFSSPWYLIPRRVINPSLFHILSPPAPLKNRGTSFPSKREGVKGCDLPKSPLFGCLFPASPTILYNLLLILP